jgi:nucleotide-binding universal stress UspA family protein
MNLPKTIVVAVDFSPESDKALQYAVTLARKLDAGIHLGHGFTVPVMPGPEAAMPLPPDVITSMERSAKQALDETVARYNLSGVPMKAHLRWEDPRNAVVDAAKELGGELVVMGTHGRKGLKRALLGSVAESVVRFAPCPVLTVR